MQILYGKEARQKLKDISEISRNMHLQLCNLLYKYEGDEYEEDWRPINGFNGYYISSFGRVKTDGIGYRNNNSKKEMILRLIKDKDGYSFVNLYNNKMMSKRVHRLVGLNFIENLEDKPFINHMNGVKDDNFYKNLEWNTPSENSKHSFDVLKRSPSMGALGRKGILSGRSRPVYCPTLAIPFINILDAADKIGVSKWTIFRILKGEQLQTNGLIFKYL